MPQTRRKQRPKHHRRLSGGLDRLEERSMLSVSPISPWDDQISGADHGSILSSSSDQRASAAATSRARAAAFNPSISPVQAAQTENGTSDKPQSKVWTHDNRWFSVFANDDGTHVWRLDGSAWTKVFTLSTDDGFKADVKSVGAVTHILLFKGSSSKLASIQYKPTSDSWEFWSQRSSLTSARLGSSVETATIDIDSTGRLWAVSDAKTTIEARYSDAPYTSFSEPITIASGINSDDISAVIALPNRTIGIMWSNQQTKRFGFKTHRDGAAPNVWSNDEVPAGSTAQNKGAGMADDHINLAVASNGTLYAAVKTGYETKNFTTIGLLVRRPSGAWDQALYQVTSKSGTRPIVVLNEAQGRLIVAYRKTNSDGPIVYKDSSTSSIGFGSERVLIDAVEANDVSSTKQNFTNEVVFIAAGTKSGSNTKFVKGAILRTNGSALVAKASTPPQTTAGSSASLQLSRNSTASSVVSAGLANIVDAAIASRGNTGRAVARANQLAEQLAVASTTVRRTGRVGLADTALADWAWDLQI